MFTPEFRKRLCSRSTTGNLRPSNDETAWEGPNHVKENINFRRPVLRVHVPSSLKR